jgi:hypothetical protein
MPDFEELTWEEAMRRGHAALLGLGLDRPGAGRGSGNSRASAPDLALRGWRGPSGPARSDGGNVTSYRP